MVEQMAKVLADISLLKAIHERFIIYLFERSDEREDI